MTVTINLHSTEQEKLLFDFLERMNFDDESDQDNIGLTEGEKKKFSGRITTLLTAKQLPVIIGMI